MDNIFNFIVLLKQVPDIEKVKFDREKGKIDRSSAEGVINPFDLNALEAAIQLKEQNGGTVTVISMGPPKAEISLRDALARGADKAILLTDRLFGGSDTLATSYTLATTIKKIQNFDLILCGEKTIDGDTAQVGAEVAEHLDIPHLAYVDEIKNISKEELLASSNRGRDHYIVKLKLPALITVNKNLNVPRFTKLHRLIQSRKDKIDKWNIDLLGKKNELNRFGFKGSPTQVVKVYVPSIKRKRSVLIQGNPEEKAKKLVEILEKEGILSGN